MLWKKRTTCHESERSPEAPEVARRISRQNLTHDTQETKNSLPPNARITLASIDFRGMIQRRETQAASLPKDIKQTFEQIELDVYCVPLVYPANGSISINVSFNGQMSTWTNGTGPKADRTIRAAAGHNTAFSVFVKALSFIFPQKWDIYLSTNLILGYTFIQLDPYFMGESLIMVKPVRNRVSVQFHICGTDSSH